MEHLTNPKINYYEKFSRKVFVTVRFIKDLKNGAKSGHIMNKNITMAKNALKISQNTIMFFSG